MGFRESWYRADRPLLLIARLLAFTVVGGYLLFVSTMLSPAGAWLPLYRTAGWILAFTALGVYMRRVPTREELEFLAVLPVSRVTQLAMWLAEGLVRHLGLALAVLCLFAGPVLASPASLGALAITYPLLWLHMHLVAISGRLLLDHLERIRWLYVLAMIPLVAAGVWFGRAVGMGTSLPQALAALGPLDRWTGIYWYAAAFTAASWTGAVRSLLAGLAELAGLAAVAVALLAALKQAPAGAPRRSGIPEQVRQEPVRRTPASTVGAAGRPAEGAAEPPHPLVTLLRHDLRLFLRRPRYVILPWVMPLGVIALFLFAGDSLLVLAREGEPEIRGLMTVLLPTLMAMTTGSTTAAIILPGDQGILGLLRSTAGSLTYLLAKWLCLCVVSVLPALAGSCAAAYLAGTEWVLTLAIAAASVIIIPALTLLMQVVRTAVGGSAREPSTSSSIWLGLGVFVYAITLVAFALTGYESLLLWVAIPAWLVAAGLGVVLAGRILDRIDLME